MKSSPASSDLLRTHLPLLAGLALLAIPSAVLQAAAPVTPELLSIQDSNSAAAQPILTWTPVANPSGGTPYYKIYRDGGTTPIATITNGDTSYTDSAPPNPYSTNDETADTRNATFSYEVSAYNPATSEESDRSAVGYYGFKRTPFVLKWNDDRYSPATDFRASTWPGGATEPPRVKIDSDGTTLITANNNAPITFLGVNFAYGANLPEPAEAAKIAARMAQFGINLVRIHNIDAYASPRGLFSDPAASTLSTAEFARLDAFIGALRDNHIYIDLNFRVGKPYEAVTSGPSSGRYKGIDLFFADYIAEQQDYITALLNHENPYAPKPGGGYHTYASDPAIAFVEINNEDGLLGIWIGGGLDGALSAHSAALKTLWNDWLDDKYGSTAAVETAWSLATTGYPAPSELLAQGGFPSGWTSPWQLNVYTGAAVASNPPSIVTLTANDVPGGGHAVLIDVTTANPGTPGKVHLLYNNVTVDTTFAHTLRFHARIGTGETPSTRTIRVGWRKHSNTALLHQSNLELTEKWREFALVLPARATNEGAIDVFFSDLAAQTGEIYIGNVSLQAGNALAPGANIAAETAADGTTDLIGNGDFPNTASIEANTDWVVRDPYPQLQPVLISSGIDASAGPGGTNAALLEVSQPNEPLGVYLQREGLNFTAGTTYAVTFDIKLDTDSPTVNSGPFIVTGKSPSTTFLSGSFSANESWTTRTHVFTASETTTDGRILFQLGQLPSGEIRIANVTVKEFAVTSLPNGETLGNISLLKKSTSHQRSHAAQIDWLEFLWDTELDYWQTMRDYILTEVDPDDRPLIIGTQVENSPCYIQADAMDVVDTHGYWQHYAQLPSGILAYRNSPMAGSYENQDTIGTRSGRRILDKPYICTEYGHGFPGTYAAEGYATIGAYAAMQGWQGICVFAYEDANLRETSASFDSGYEGVWTMGRAPAKMATMPFAAQALSGIARAPATELAAVVTNKRTALEVIRQKFRTAIGATDFASGSLAIDPRSALTLNLGTRLDGNDCYLVRPSITPVSGTVTNPLLAPAQDLAWTTTPEVARVKIIGPKTKAFFGHFDPESSTPIGLGDDVSIALDRTAQFRKTLPAETDECWGGVTLLLKEGASFGASGSRWLVTTGGYADNYKTTWTAYRGPRAYQTSTTGGPVLSAVQSLGGMPSFVERISGNLSFKVGNGRLAAYSLDEDGNRLAPLAVGYSGSGAATVATATILPTTPTMWYEMGVDMPSTAATLSFPASANGYGAAGTTAIGVKDTALAANTTGRTTDDAAWQKIGAVSDAAALTVSSDTSSPGNVSGTNSLLLSPPGTQSVGGWIDLRGQNLPSFAVWEFEGRLQFTSSTNDTVDDLHLVIGQGADFPVIHVALNRPVSGSQFSVQLQTGGGMETFSSVSSGTWVKVRVKVTPPGASGAPSGGKLELWINDVTQTLADTTLPSTSALPDELHVFTGAAATGNGRIDEIKLTLP